MTKLYDPYYQNDPTKPETFTVPEQGRTHSGRYNHKSLLHDLNPETLPIDSVGWRSYAMGAWEELADLTGDHYALLADMILPPEVVGEFSWRMIAEMVDAAVEQAKVTPYDNNLIVAAAHSWLEEKQITTKGVDLDDMAEAHLRVRRGEPW